MLARYSLTARPPALLDALLSLWEASVRATHHFLREADIYALRPLVREGLAHIPTLVVEADDAGVPLGFMGLDGTMIEMLFIAPKARGQGLGKLLVKHARETFGAHKVDVNEQNTEGVGFYIHIGFEVIARSAYDAQGNPFPLLHMQLFQEDQSLPPGYSLRHAESAHLPFLNGIEVAAAAIFPPGSIPEAIRNEAMPQSILRAAMEKARLWVVLHQGAPVGYAVLDVIDQYALLAQLDVHPDHGRKGLGSALVRRVIKAVGGMSLPGLYLTTFARFPWNAPLYTRLGFKRLEQAEQPPFIRRILEQEQAHGLDGRVAMRCDVP